MRDEFVQLLARRYSTVKAQHPGEGRRKWQLRVLQEFWAAPHAVAQNTVDQTSAEPALADEYLHDPDPLDYLTEGRELGLLLRTDFSDDNAWTTFCSRLDDAEKEFSEFMKPDDAIGEMKGDGPQSSASSSDVKMEGSDDDSDSDSSDEGIPCPIIKIVNQATTAEGKAIFNGVSNIAALRLLNDVDLRPSPALPADTKRVSPAHRLVDQAGWQEIYTGMNVWIYDTQSNTDQCLRLVGQQGDVYGTATGDSWRARVSHVCELQFNMSYTGMKIDFGGLDRWDYSERRRNKEVAELPIV